MGSTSVLTYYPLTNTQCNDSNVLNQNFADLANNLDGVTGLQGPTGIQGVTGPSAGPQGHTGLRGMTGIRGQTGIYGDTGLQGATGVWLGITGPQGHTGIANFYDRSDWPSVPGLVTPVLLWNQEDEALYAGTTGIGNWVQISAGSKRGASGALGNTGAQGITGVGFTGVQGASGIQGVQGITGLIGGTGIQGTTGIQGITGVGYTGVQGGTGIQGQTGIADYGAISEDLIPATDDTYDIGAADKEWDSVYLNDLYFHGTDKTTVLNADKVGVGVDLHSTARAPLGLVSDSTDCFLDMSSTLYAGIRANVQSGEWKTYYQLAQTVFSSPYNHGIIWNDDGTSINRYYPSTQTDLGYSAFPWGEVYSRDGYFIDSTAGDTTDVVISGVTLSFKGGILTGVS